MFKGLSRTIAGKQALKYKFEIQIIHIENLPAPVKSCRVVWSRQAKVQMTKQVTVSSGTAKFNEALSQVATIYKDQKNQLEAKEYSFKVEVPGKADQWMVLGRSPLDMTKYITMDNGPQTAMIPIQFKVGSGSTGYLKVTITASMLKALTPDDAMTDVSGMTGISHGQSEVVEQDLSGFDDNMSSTSANSDKGTRKLYGTTGKAETSKAAETTKPKQAPPPLNLQPGKQEAQRRPIVVDDEDEDISPLSASPEESPRVPEPRPAPKVTAVAPTSRGVEKTQAPSGREEADRRELFSADKPSRSKTPEPPAAETKPRSGSRATELNSVKAVGFTADGTADSQQLRALQAENEKLRAQIEALKEANLQFDEANREFVNREAKLKQQREEYKAKVLQLEEALREAVQRVSQQQSDPLAGEVQSLRRQLEEAEQRHSKAKADLEKRAADAFKMVDESMIVAARTEQEKNGMKDQVAKLQSLLEETRQEVAALETSKAMAEMDRDAARAEAVKAVADMEQAAGRGEATKASGTGKSGGVGPEAPRGWQPAAVVAAKDMEIEGLKTQVANLQSRLGDVRSLSDDTEQLERIAQLEAQLEEAQGAAREAELKALKERNELQRQLGAASERTAELEEAGRKLEVANRKLEATLADANGRQGSTAAAAGAADHQLAEAASRYGELQQQHESLRQQYEALELQVAGQNATIDDLRERGGGRRDDYSDDEDDAGALRESVSQLQQQVQQLKSRVSSLEGENESLERRLQEEDEERAVLEERLRAHMADGGDDAANETVAAYEDKYNKLRAKYRELEEKGKETEEDLAEAEERIEKLEKQLRSLGSARDAAEKQSEGLESAVVAGRSAAVEAESIRKENEALMLQLVSCKLELAQVSEREVIARRELYKAKETHMKLAAKMTKLETMLWSKDSKKK